MLDWEDRVKPAIMSTAAIPSMANAPSTKELRSIIVFTSSLVGMATLFAQPILTSMLLGRAFSDFGRWTLSTPSLNSAATFSPSASSGRVKLRAKLP